MGLLNSFKERLSLNLKVTKLSFMTNPNDILQYCQAFTPGERSLALKNIESQFKWQPIAKIAQAMYPTLYGSHGGVSADAMDLIQGGYVEAGVKLMGIENQPPVAPNFGMLPIQQCALSFAWVALNAMQQRDAVLTSSSASLRGSAPLHTASYGFCSSCGSPRELGAYFCTRCGQRV
jgi:hypothetical protein